MLRRRYLWISAVLAAGLTIGCWRHEIVMEIDGDTIRRTTQAPGSDPDNPDNLLPPAVSRFAGEIPRDLSGHPNAGRVVRVPSLFGVSYLYMERLGGTDAIAASAEQAIALGRTVAPQWSAFLRHAVGNDPALRPALNKLDRDLPDELANLCLYGWMLSLQPDDADLRVRAAAYLMDHGFLTPEDLLRVSQMLLGCESGDLDAWSSVVRRIALRKLGLDPDRPLPPAAEALASTETFIESLKAWAMANIPAPDEAADGDADASDEPALLAWPLLEIAYPVRNLSGLFGSGVDVRFRTWVEPVWTNGSYEPDRGTIGWSANAAGELGSLAYAAWATPASAYQKRFLGRVALQRDRLLDYCLWEHGLTGDQRLQWLRFVRSLRPSAARRSLAAALKAAKANPADPLRFALPALLLLNDRG